MSISVAMITYNGETKIEKTLKSVRGWVDEIAAVDSHSTDATVQILSRYRARVFDEDWKGEGLQYQSVVSKCTSEWILILDQDEVVTETLQKAIIQELINPRFEVYELTLQNICFGKRMNVGQTMHKKILFKKGCETFKKTAWHSEMSTEYPVGKINGIIDHYTYNDIEEYFDKFNRYTSDLAVEMFKKGKAASFSKIILSPIIVFFQQYLFKKNMFNGMEGFLLSLFSALYASIKYAKLRELRRNSSK
jgi:glycosyltransferase involved in cell wall biosynthesis